MVNRRIIIAVLLFVIVAIGAMRSNVALADAVATATVTSTSTPTPTATSIPATATPSPTATTQSATSTPTPSRTATPQSNTATPTRTPTSVSTATSSPTPTKTNTPVAATATSTPAVPGSATPTATSALEPTPTSSSTFDYSVTMTPQPVATTDPWSSSYWQTGSWAPYLGGVYRGAIAQPTARANSSPTPQSLLSQLFRGAPNTGAATAATPYSPLANPNSTANPLPTRMAFAVGISTPYAVDNAPPDVVSDQSSSDSSSVDNPGALPEETSAVDQTASASRWLKAGIAASSGLLLMGSAVLGILAVLFLLRARLR